MPDTATIDTEDAVRNAALAADRGETAEATTAADTATSDAETDTQPSPENNGQPAEQGSDAITTSEDAEPKKEAAQEKKPETDKTAKPESAFSKAQKEKARFDGVRKKFHEEQEAFRAERKQFEQERAAFQQERARLTQTQPAAKPETEGPGAEAYEEAAKRYEQEGDSRMAQLAREKAAELRAKAQQQQQQTTAAAPAGDHTQDPQFKAQWNQHVADLVKSHPELNDGENPLGKQTMGLIRHPVYGRFFKAHPDGIKMAHEVAQVVLQAGKAKAIEGELAKAKAEVERLTKLTSLRGAPPPSGAGGAKTALSELSGEAAEDFVRQAAMKADRGEST